MVSINTHNPISINTTNLTIQEFLSIIPFGINVDSNSIIMDKGHVCNGSHSFLLIKLDNSYGPSYKFGFYLPSTQFNHLLSIDGILYKPSTEFKFPNTEVYWSVL